MCMHDIGYVLWDLLDVAFGCGELGWDTIEY